MERCWESDPARRPAFTDLISSVKEIAKRYRQPATVKLNLMSQPWGSAPVDAVLWLIISHPSMGTTESTAFTSCLFFVFFLFANLWTKCLQKADIFFYIYIYSAANVSCHCKGELVWSECCTASDVFKHAHLFGGSDDHDMGLDTLVSFPAWNSEVHFDSVLDFKLLPFISLVTS